jgi:hypothetical protein
MAKKRKRTNIGALNWLKADIKLASGKGERERIINLPVLGSFWLL